MKPYSVYMCAYVCMYVCIYTTYTTTQISRACQAYRALNPHHALVSMLQEAEEAQKKRQEDEEQHQREAEEARQKKEQVRLSSLGRPRSKNTRHVALV